MPARATIFRWLARHPEFRRSYANTRDCQMEDLMDEILEIVDDSSRDYVEKTGAIKAGGLNRSTQHLEQLAINNDDSLPNRSPKCFQRIPPQPAIPITGFALPPSYHHEISDLSANNRSLPSKGKCCVDRLNPSPRKWTLARLAPKKYRYR